MGTKTRRSVLIVGAGTLAALAGCSSGNDDRSPGVSETTTSGTTASEQPTTLDVNNPVLCSEKPTGYREYTEQPNSTYDPGEVIWVYFEPSTTGTESAGEGEIRFEYDFTISVMDPDGENLGSIEDTAGRTVSEGADLQKVFLFASYSPPMEFEGGTHTLEVEVTDTIADNTATETIEFEVDSGLTYASGEFGIERFAFTEGEARGYRDYDESSPAEFGTTETVWYYYEIDGFAYEETENEKTLDLEITETLTGPEGDVWSEADIPLSNTFEPSTDLDTYYITDYLSPSQEWLPGEYELRFEVMDGYAEETVTEEYSFTIVE